MALVAERDTHMQDGEVISAPIAANVKAFAGGLAAANATGYATPGAVAATLTYLGRFEETVDNTGGAAGAKNVQIRRGKAFKFKNSGADAVTQASLGKACYIVDDETVAATNGAGARSAAGIVVGLDADGVWVQ
ncbi:hypothetical protein [Sideroxydans lithotrophicus]|uniref:Bacteriophage protein n=1 Tax=Sideroxydans lithotrophicus (strain ES-1) TaxID=580332 RepID=D5CUD5_SIDLE|nr:hypothetical protein [Sideroxydans lithotrophicus]ADE10470.1 conserved hypothetical protein [Sideroxydans lithotrophicus ES-1]